MTDKVTVVPIGEGVGIVFSPNMLATLGVKIGDELVIRRLENGIELRPARAEFDRQIAVAEQVMAKDYNLLRKLAE